MRVQFKGAQNIKIVDEQRRDQCIAGAS